MSPWIALVALVAVGLVAGRAVVASGRAVGGTGALSRTRQLAHRVPGVGTWWRPVVLGVAFGTVWASCVGPLLGAARVPTIGAGSPTAGAGLIAPYAAGIGLPLIIVSPGFHAVPGALDRLRRLGPSAGLVAGVSLVALGLLLITGLTDAVVPGTVARAAS